VGYGLEPILTDALSSVILQEKVLPKFKARDMQGGIVAGTDAIVEQLLLDAPAAKARVAQAEKQLKDQDNGFDPFTALFIGFIIFMVISSFFRRGRGGGMGVLPWIILGSMGRGGGGRDWGGGSGWGGGGGFSGGGGSFGGGGASGSW
jgi:uncharacterized protein